jgi:DNA-binding response OmpR family regulator
MYPQGQHILLIDSDARRRQQAERLLTEEGFAVTAVADGFSAIRAASNYRFVLAVAALKLPGTLDGATTLRQIRLRQPGLRALFIGAAGAAATVPEWLDAACEDFIAAPIQRRELLGCVFELLQRGRSGGMRTRAS